tara:strand:+ start:964 stop:1161 length:198 start_codon:yes stop_codon:yes gene_type:complete
LQLHQRGAAEGLEVMRLAATVQGLAQQGVEGGVLQEAVAYQEVEAMVKRGHLLICSFFDVARTHL